MLNRLRQLLTWTAARKGPRRGVCHLSPRLITIIGGIFEFGWSFYWQHTVTNASRAGARYGVQAKYPGGISTPCTVAEIKNIVKT